MSKAFTRESDDQPERPLAPRPVPVLPPGARNYITPTGAERLRAELESLRQSNPNPDQPANARQTALQRILQSIEVTPPPPPPHDHVRFGATVTVRDGAGEKEKFSIVGVDEADPAEDRISWLSPLARGLMNARLGERITLQLPGGERLLEIVAIAYE